MSSFQVFLSLDLKLITVGSSGHRWSEGVAYVTVLHVFPDDWARLGLMEARTSAGRLLNIYVTKCCCYMQCLTSQSCLPASHRVSQDTFPSPHIQEPPPSHRVNMGEFYDQQVPFMVPPSVSGRMPTSQHTPDMFTVLREGGEGPI